jgi:sugar/nucleoside kinase (ribokinase family)
LSATLTVVGLVYFEVAAPIDAVRIGREKLVDRIEVGIGGAFNTAWIAHALGLPVVLAHPAGTGMTDRATATLISGLGLPAITWKGRDETAISLVLTARNDRGFVSAADFGALEYCPDLIGSSWIHVPGLREARVLQARLAAARARGARISVSASWAMEELDVLARSRPPWDLLFLNELEAERAVGSVADAPARLREVSPSVVVTRGARGAFGTVGGERFSVPARSIEVQNATGAGDAFAAGFLAASARGASPVRAAEIGCEVAARRLSASGQERYDRALFDGVGLGE